MKILKPAWCDYPVVNEKGHTIGFLSQLPAQRARPGYERWQAWSVDRELVGTFGGGAFAGEGRGKAMDALQRLWCCVCGEPRTCEVGERPFCSVCGAEALSAMFESALPVPGSKEVIPIGSACAIGGKA